jgi:hypothetical protein
MTGIDELIRESLVATANEHAQPADLAARSIQQGQRIRRHRQAGVAVAALMSVVVVVGGSLAVAGVGPSHPGATQTIRAAGQPGSAAWSTIWPDNRVYGDPPTAKFLSDTAQGAKVYASGTMPDGTNFEVSSVKGRAPTFTQGWFNAADFGEAVGEGPTTGPQAEYFTLESPTYLAGRQDVGTSQWLVVVGWPGTTSASYTADGANWQAMDVQNGIAALKLPALAPRSAQIALSDASGQYVDGPLFTP